MKRLFFALWPDAATRQQCLQIQQALPKLGCRPVAAHNLHVTLVFLGNVDQQQEQALLEAAADIPAVQVQIEFDQLAFWQKPQVLCLTARHIEAELARLVTQLTNAARLLHIAIDERPYQAHVTLARKAKQAVDLQIEPIIWRAHSFCLVESCSTPAGVDYRLCQTWS
ncbi:MAG: RNA 2',3'-cyclic phosphodiesterase [Methylococcales bacterium]